MTGYVDKYVFEMNQVVSMNVAHDICYEDESYDTNKDATVKRKQRLKIMLQDYYNRYATEQS